MSQDLPRVARIMRRRVGAVIYSLLEGLSRKEYGLSFHELLECDPEAALGLVNRIGPGLRSYFEEYVLRRKAHRKHRHARFSRSALPGTFPA